MIQILAKIKLYENERKTQFKSGYRPLFNFMPDMKTSGRITLKEIGFELWCRRSRHLSFRRLIGLSRQRAGAGQVLIKSKERI